MRSLANRPPSIECRGLVAGYSSQSPVLDGFTWLIEGPGIHRIDAPNGAGKSTLIEVVSGYLRPLAGEALLNGLAAHDPSTRALRRICRTSPALYPHMNVEDHLVFASRLTGADVDETLERAERLGLGDWLAGRADLLSTGSARKLWYVMCTTGDFSVVALDEPFNGLDESATQVLCDELMQWSQDRLVVIVCHSVARALSLNGVVRLDRSAEPPGSIARLPGR